MTREHIHEIYVWARLAVPSKLPDEAVAEVAGVVVREMAEDGVLTLEIRHGERSSDQVLNEVGDALWYAGWTFAEAKITEMVDEAISQAVVLALSGGTPGAYIKNEQVTFFGAVAGFFAGLWTGSQVKKVGAEYRARWAGEGWEVTKLVERAPTRPAIEPA